MGKTVKDFDPILDVARYGDLDQLRRMIEGGANFEVRDQYGMTTAIKACIHGQAACLSALVNVGASLDTKAETGMTTLLGAAQYGHAECLWVLVRAGPT